MAGLTGHRSGKLAPCIIAAMHRKFILITVFVAVGTAAIYLYFALRPGGARQIQAIAWIRDPASRPDLVITRGSARGKPRFSPDGRHGGLLWMILPARHHHRH
jgi:hypothetical protein